MQPVACIHAHKNMHIYTLKHAYVCRIAADKSVKFIFLGAAIASCVVTAAAGLSSEANNLLLAYGEVLYVCVYICMYMYVCLLLTYGGVFMYQ